MRPFPLEARALLRLIAASLLAPTLVAQGLPPGPQVLTFFSTVDNTDQPFAVYVPKNFDPAKKYPLVVSLHGAGSNHRLNLRRVFGKGNLIGQTDAEASRGFPPLPDVDFIVASPLARGTIGYWGVAERDVYDMLAEVKKWFPIDDDRIFLTGLSLGGGGVLRLGLTRPDVWAAIAAVCPADPPAIELAANALNLPVRLFQGALDPIVPVTQTRQWYKRFLDLETNVDYLEYRGVRHNAWDTAYRGAEIFDWFSNYRRNPHPDHVRYVSSDYEHRSAYWVQLDALTPGTPASIDARFTAANQLVVETKALDGFTLNLAGHPSFRTAAVVTVTIDGVKMRPVRGGKISFVRSGDAWKPGAYKFGPHEKQPDAEGPIARAVSNRHIYVYGTADSPGPEELERRRQIARDATDWNFTNSVTMLSPRVAADNELKDSDLDGADLVLLGTRATNSLIARWADRIPIQLNPGAADFGLLEIVPVDGHYLLISSGLPWWRNARTGTRGIPIYLPVKPALLQTLGDYILFRKSIDDVVAEGRFDRNWALSQDQAEKMKATGAVSLH